MLKYCTQFFIRADKLWKKDHQGQHKQVVFHGQHLAILCATYDGIRHNGYYVTYTFICEHFWWPQISHDVHWFMCTCHLCQLQQTCNILIPLTIAMPVPLFAKMYM